MNAPHLVTEADQEVKKITAKPIIFYQDAPQRSSTMTSKGYGKETGRFVNNSPADDHKALMAQTLNTNTITESENAKYMSIQ